MPNRRRGKKRRPNEGALGTNKRRAGLSPSLRVDETMRQGLSTFDGVDETVAHGLSPGERFDETGAVASYKCSAGLSPSPRVDETVHGLSPCDRRLDETGAVAGSSSSASELKCIVSSGKFVFLYLVVGCCVLCLPRPSTTFASRCAVPRPAAASVTPPWNGVARRARPPPRPPLLLAL